MIKQQMDMGGTHSVIDLRLVLSLLWVNCRAAWTLTICATLEKGWSKKDTGHQIDGPKLLQVLVEPRGIEPLTS